jgi:DNA gyrase subunit A
MLPVREFTEGHFVVLGTRRGIVKKTPLAAFANRRASGIIALTIDDGDGLLGAALSRGDDEIFMATAKGMSIRFHESDVRPMGRNARGVIGIRLRDEDSVVAMQVLSGKPDVLAVTQNGYGKRTPVEEYRRQSRGGTGIINIRAGGRNGEVVASMEMADEDQLLLITSAGKIIRMNVSGVSRIGRATQGVRLIQLEEGDAVASAIRTAEDEAQGPEDGTEGSGPPADAEPSEGDVA